MLFRSHKAFRIVFSEGVVNFIEANNENGKKFFHLYSRELIEKKKLVAKLTSDDILNSTKKAFIKRKATYSPKPHSLEHEKQTKKIVNQIVNYKTISQIKTHQKKFKK